MDDEKVKTTKEMEEKYKTEGNIKYAVLAIGSWYKTTGDGFFQFPPLWAFLACSHFQYEYEKTLTPFHGNYARGPRGTQNEIIAYEEFLWTFVHRKNKHAAAKKATGQDDSGAAVKKFKRWLTYEVDNGNIVLRMQDLLRCLVTEGYSLEEALSLTSDALKRIDKKKAPRFMADIAMLLKDRYTDIPKGKEEEVGFKSIIEFARKSKIYDQLVKAWKSK